MSDTTKMLLEELKTRAAAMVAKYIRRDIQPDGLLTVRKVSIPCEACDGAGGLDHGRTPHLTPCAECNGFGFRWKLEEPAPDLAAELEAEPPPTPRELAAAAELLEEYGLCFGDHPNIVPVPDPPSSPNWETNGLELLDAAEPSPIRERSELLNDTPRNRAKLDLKIDPDGNVSAISPEPIRNIMTTISIDFGAAEERMKTIEDLARTTSAALRHDLAAAAAKVATVTEKELEELEEPNE